MKVIKKFLKDHLELIQSFGIIVAIVSSIVGVFIALNQLESLKKEISINSIKYSADAMLYLDNQLNSGNNKGIEKAIEHEKPLLKDSGGLYSKDDLERYLDLIETLNDFYYSGLITQRMVCVNFSILVDETYQNSEVIKYITESRDQDKDNSIYEGLTNLYQEMEPFQGQECPK